MLNDIKAVIFDLDGTLVDSMWMWRDIDIEFLSQFKQKLPTDLQKEIEGMSFSETAHYFKETFKLPISEEEMKAMWNSMAYEKYTNEVPLKEGVYDFLRYLKDKGVKIGIATSNSKELVSAVIKSLGVEDFFHSIHTACEVDRGKPAPDIYKLVAEDLNVPPEHCLVFEDIPAGIMAGHAAGMKTCAVKDEYSNHLIARKKELADYYIDTYNDILTRNYEVLA